VPTSAAAVEAPTKTAVAAKSVPYVVRRETGRARNLERPTLPLAGHGGGREADREDARDRDRDGVDDAQGDGAGQAEDVAAAELHELRRDRPGVDELLDLGTDRRVDDLGVDERHEHAPDGQRDAHDEQLPALRGEGPAEKHPVHQARSSA
jgi:hypothetical protein